MGTAIGQGSGVYYSRKDEKGGGENLEETMDIGAFTGLNVLDHNIGSGKVRQIGLDGVREDVDASNGYTLQNDITGGFGESWFNFTEFGIKGLSYGYNSGDNALWVFLTDTFWQVNLNDDFVPVAILELKKATGFEIGFPTIIKRASLSPNALPELKAQVTPDQSTGLHYATIATVNDKVAYDEKFGAIFVNTANATWQTIIVPTAPVNKVVDILILNTSAAARTGGVRKVGSSLLRVALTNSDSVVMTTTTDGTGQIMIFSSLFVDIDFRLIGIHGV